MNTGRKNNEHEDEPVGFPFIPSRKTRMPYFSEKYALFVA